MPLHQIEDGFAVFVHREPLPLPLQARVTKPNKHDKNPQRPVSDLETANGERVTRRQKCEGLGFEYAPGGGGRAGGGGKENDTSLLIVDEQGARLLRPQLPESRHGRRLWSGPVAGDGCGGTGAVGERGRPSQGNAQHQIGWALVLQACLDESKPSQM
jgi:hypothetical protein